MIEVHIREFDASDVVEHLQELTEILYETVNSGASVGFILPFSTQDSHRFWTEKILHILAKKERLFLVALIEKKVIGTVQLDIDMLPNQHHRGEVSKLLVHPDFRQQGIARKLMETLEAKAKEYGKKLLTLDTRTGDRAEQLYQSLGYKRAGILPGYCRAPEKEHYESTTYMYKSL